MLATGNIIEIVRTDGDGEVHLRRVRVKSSRISATIATVVGVNLRGKFPKTYRLPTEPLAVPFNENELPRDSVNWYPFENTGECDP